MIDIYGVLSALKFNNTPSDLQSFFHEFFLFLVSDRVQYHRAILFLDLRFNIFAITGV